MMITNPLWLTDEGYPEGIRMEECCVKRSVVKATSNWSHRNNGSCNVGIFRWS